MRHPVFYVQKWLVFSAYGWFKSCWARKKMTIFQGRNTLCWKWSCFTEDCIFSLVSPQQYKSFWPLRVTRQVHRCLLLQRGIKDLEILYLLWVFHSNCTCKHLSRLTVETKCWLLVLSVVLSPVQMPPASLLSHVLSAEEGYSPLPKAPPCPLLCKGKRRTLNAGLRDCRGVKLWGGSHIYSSSIITPLLFYHS